VASLFYSSAARADLSDIWSMIAASNGERLADTMLDRIIARAESLLQHPALGPERPDIAPHARSLLMDRWLILYRVDGDEIRVVRVLDGARDLRRLARPEPDPA
jgi:toxin ParE1/3/4